MVISSLCSQLASPTLPMFSTFSKSRPVVFNRVHFIDRPKCRCTGQRCGCDEVRRAVTSDPCTLDLSLPDDAESDVP